MLDAPRVTIARVAAADLGALVDAVQYDDRYFDEVGRDKRPTVMLILFTWGFGGLWYWLRVRPQLVKLRGR